LTLRHTSVILAYKPYANLMPSIVAQFLHMLDNGTFFCYTWVVNCSLQYNSTMGQMQGK